MKPHPCHDMKLHHETASLSGYETTYQPGYKLLMYQSGYETTYVPVMI
jgi:hypothetical protein